MFYTNFVLYHSISYYLVCKITFIQAKHQDKYSEISDIGYLVSWSKQEFE